MFQVFAFCLGIIAQYFLMNSIDLFDRYLFLSDFRQWVHPHISFFIGISLYLTAIIIYCLPFATYPEIEDEPLLMPFDKLKTAEKTPLKRYHQILFLPFLATGACSLIYLFYHMGIQNQYSHFYFYIWLISIITFGIAILIREKQRIKFTFPTILKGEIFFLITLMLFGTILLVPYIGTIPYDVHVDEGNIILYAQKLLHNSEENLLGYSGWYRMPNLSFLLTLLPQLVFKDSFISTRVFSILLAMITIPAFYFLAKMLFNRNIAAISSIIFVSSHIFIAFFRTGINYNQSLSLFIITLLFFIGSLKTNNKFLMYCAGVSSGLGFYVYFSGRAILPVLCLFLLYLLITEKSYRSMLWKQTTILIVGFLITLLPLLLITFHAPYMFHERFLGVSIFHEGYAETCHFFHTHNIFLLFLANILHALLSFNLYFDTSSQYGNMRAFLEYITSVVFVFGLTSVLKRFYQPQYILLGGTFFFFVITGWGCTKEVPFFPRLIIILPIVSLIAAIGLLNIKNNIEHTLEQFNVWKKGAPVFLMVCLCMIILSNFETYFGNYIARMTYDINTKISRILAYHMNTQSKNYDFYSVYSNNYDYTYQIAHTLPSFLIFKHPHVPLYKIDLHKNPSLQIKQTGKAACFIIHQKDFQSVQNILATRYPQSTMKEIINGNGDTLFIMYYSSIYKNPYLLPQIE